MLRGRPCFHCLGLCRMLLGHCRVVSSLFENFAHSFRQSASLTLDVSPLFLAPHRGHIRVGDTVDFGSERRPANYSAATPVSGYIEASAIARFTLLWTPNSVC